MSRKRPKVQPSDHRWETENLRLTAFVRGQDDMRGRVSWAKFMGSEPEISQSRPHQGTLLEAGPYSDGWLTLEVTLDRVHWQFAVRRDETVPFAGLPILGPFDQTRTSFQTLMCRWLKTCPRLDRLAFGAILLSPVDTRVKGYRRLSKFLPGIKIDPKHSTDFSYQINRRRTSKSGMEGLEINRLTRWSVASTSTVLLEMSPQSSKAYENGKTAYACRLALDINTDQEFRSGLHKTKLLNLFRELVEIGTEISTKGDIP